MKLVTNTSPLIFLGKLGALPLLSQCFAEIYIPQAVYREFGSMVLPSAIRLQKISVPGEQFVSGAMGRLHRGELETMVLAQEIKADYVCLDDLSARHKARTIRALFVGGFLQTRLIGSVLSGRRCRAGWDLQSCPHRYLELSIIERHLVTMWTGLQTPSSWVNR